MPRTAGSEGERAFRRTLNTNRWVTAFPDEGGATIGLMQALDRNFQRELIKEDEATYERFSSVVKLPPILHIHIQRTTRDGGKNMAPIEIPEALYLDRFMDGPAGGDLFKKRQRGWDLSERLRSLKGTDGGGELQMPHMDDPELDIVKDYNKCVIDQFMNDDTPEGVEDDGFTIINDELTALFEAHDITPPHTPPAQDEDMGVTRQTLKEALNPAVAEAFAKRSEDSEEAYRRELEELFADMQKEKYRLHAVICHAGQTGRSGHYWVWIFDFEKDVWRKYNDSDVTEQANTGEVMQTLSSRGEPYYLAYVRDDAVSAMVDIPYRGPGPARPGAFVSLGTFGLRDVGFCPRSLQVNSRRGRPNSSESVGSGGPRRDPQAAHVTNSAAIPRAFDVDWLQNLGMIRPLNGGHGVRHRGSQL